MAQFAILALLLAIWQSAAGLAAEPSPLAYRFVPGERAVYKLQYDNSSASDFGALFDKARPTQQEKPAALGLASSFDTKVSGEFSATVLDENKHDC